MRNRVINRLGVMLRSGQGRKGQTLVEYALVLSFISVLCVAFLSALGQQVHSLYLSILNPLANALASLQ